MSEMSEFLKALEKDPNLVKKIKKKEEKLSFLSQHNLKEATPLKCPACAAVIKTPGSLYVNKDDPTKFVCRKCKLEFILDCINIPMELLISNLRKVNKQDEEATLEWYMRYKGEK